MVTWCALKQHAPTSTLILIKDRLYQVSCDTRTEEHTMLLVPKSRQEINLFFFSIFFSTTPRQGTLDMLNTHRYHLLFALVDFWYLPFFNEGPQYS